MANNTLIDLGSLSTPATALIERVSDAIGKIYEPSHIRRVARAEADAEEVKRKKEIELSELEQRALRRRLDEEVKSQVNIESITAQACNYVNDEASPGNIEEDWLRAFFDKARRISDEDMQQIWSKILAGEANNPGHFSPLTIDVVSKMRKRDAETFTRLGSFVWYDDTEEYNLYVFNSMTRSYGFFDVKWKDVYSIEALGLIEDKMSEFVKFINSFDLTLFYFDRCVKISMKNVSPQLPCGRLKLTSIGTELFPFCGAEFDQDIFDYTIQEWQKHGFSVNV